MYFLGSRLNIKSVVLKIGGSIIFPNFPPNADHFLRVANGVYSFIKKVKEHNPNAKIAITVGGGVPAKQYIKLAESLGLSAYVRDLIGISVTRINALILLNCVKELLEEKKGVKLYRAISSEIPTSAFKALKMIDSSDIIFVGGYFPGQSTIGPAALTAEAIKADLLLIATDVPGVFTKDPTKDPSAKKITQIRVKELKNLLIEQEAKPGTYKVCLLYTSPSPRDRG